MSRTTSPTKRRLYRRDGSYYELEDYVTDEQIASLREQDPDVLPDPTFLGSIGEGIKSIPKGVAGSALSMARGITALAPGDTGAADQIDAMQRRIGESVDPRYRESYATMLGMGLGSTLPFLAASVTPLGVAGAAATGALSGAGDQATRMDAFEDAGNNVDLWSRLTATALGAAVGSTEALPLGRLTSKVIPGALEAGAKKLAQNAIGSAVAQGFEEGVQEFGSGIAQNLVERVSYNPDQDALGSLSDFTVGAGSGALMDLATRAIVGRYGRYSQGILYDAEAASRNQRLQDRLATKIDEVNNVISETESAGVEFTPEIFNKQYDIRQEADGTYSVFDTQTNQVIAPAMASMRDATEMMNSATDEAIDTAAVAGVIQKLRNQGVDTDPLNVHLGLMVTHPDYTHVPIEMLAPYVTDTEMKGRTGSPLDPSSKMNRELTRGSQVLQELRAQGKNFISIPEARRILPEAQFDQFALRMAAVTSQHLASINRDVAANRTKNGLPRLRNHDESMEFISSLSEESEKILSGQGYQPKVKITTNDIRNLLHNKGYLVGHDLMRDTPNIKTLVYQMTGGHRLNKDSDKALFFTRIASLPARRGANRKLPDFGYVMYSQAKRKEALDILMRAGEPIKKRDWLDHINLEPAIRDQLVDHLIESGRIKIGRKNNSGIQYVSYVEPGQVELNRDIERGEELVRSAIRDKGVPGQIIREQFAEQRKMLAEAANVTETEVDEAIGSPDERADTINEVAERNQKVIDMIKDRVFKRMSLPVSGKGNRGIEVSFVDDMKNITEAITRAVASGDPKRLPTGAIQVDPKSGEAQILLNMAALDPDGVMSVDELYDAVLPTVSYEMVRWLRENDYFTQSQWETLRRFVRKNIVPDSIKDGSGKSWFDWAAEEIDAAPDSPGYQEAVFETAIAKAFEGYAFGHISDPETGPKQKRSLPGALFKRMTDHIKGVINSGRDANIAPALSVFRDIVTGKIGRRGAGRSAINPKGQIRSLRDVDRGLVDVEAYRRAAADAGAEPDAPVRRANLPEDVIRANRAKRDAEVANAGQGIPRVSVRASDEALNVYYGTRDATGTERPAVRFRFARNATTPDVVYADDHVGRINYSPDDRTKFEKVIDAIEGDEALSDPGGLWDSIVESLKQKAAEVRQNTIDSRDQVEKLSAEVNKKRMAEGYDQYMADASAIAAFRWLDASQHFLKQAISTGKIVYRDGHFVAETLVDEDGDEYKGLNDLFRLLNNSEGKNDEVDAHTYVINKRLEYLIPRAINAQKELKARGKVMNSRERAKLQKIVDAGRRVPGGSSMTMEENLADARKFIAKIEGDPNKEHIVKFAKGYRAWNDSLIDLMSDTGILAKEDVDSWKNTLYLPFYKRNERDEFLPVALKRGKKDRVARKATIEMSLEGSTDKLDVDLITSLVSNAENIIRDSMINEAHSRVVRDMEYMGLAEPAPSSDINTVMYYDGGVQKFVRMKDMLLFQSISATDSTLFNHWRIFPMAAQVLRETVTRDPTFMIRNVLRDSASAFVTSGANFTPLAATMSKLNLDAYERAKKAGLSLDHDFVNDENRYRSQIKKYLAADEDTPRGIMLRIWDGLGTASKMSDAATRMAVYDDVLERTGNEAEAIYQAMEVINFGRRGRDPLLRVFMASIPFLNARVQGLDVLWRAGTGQYSAAQLTDPKEIQARVFTRGAMLAAMTGLYFAAVSDTDWYKNLRDELKDDYWFFSLPGDTLMRVPIPFEVGLLFKTIPELMMRAASEEGFSSKDALKSFGREAGQATQFNVVPQLFSPALDVIRNRDSYSGREIVPQYMEDAIEGGAQYDVDTNEFARVIGEKLNYSPKKIEYLLRGYFGPLAVYSAAVADAVTRTVTDRSGAGTRNDLLDINNIPGLRGVFTRKSSGGGYQNQFYDLRQEVDRFVGTLNKYTNEGSLEEAQAYRHENAALEDVRGTVRRLDRYMQRWRDRREALLTNQTLTEEQRRTAMRMLEEERDMQLAIVPFLREYTKEAR